LIVIPRWTTGERIVEDGTLFHSMQIDSSYRLAIRQQLILNRLFFDGQECLPFTFLCLKIRQPDSGQSKSGRGTKVESFQKRNGNRG